LLVALHLHDGEPVRLTRTVGPSAQQACLPAAGRSRDDRHLPRRRAIQSGEKITPVDQPGSCWSHLQGLPRCLRRTPFVGDTVLSLSGERTPCQRRANHYDPVMTYHLPGGKPESVAKARTAVSGRAHDSREMT
jgi:hypothetical protein